MGIRGIIRDILSIYLSYKIIMTWLFNESFTLGTGIVAVLLLLLSVWFVLERIGIIPKL